jgi:hypothetical protein
MTDAEDNILHDLKFDTEQAAWYANVLSAVVQFKELHGNLPSPKVHRSESKSKEEERLAKDLITVRRARHRDIRVYRKALGGNVIVRRVLTPNEISAWECQLGERIWQRDGVGTDQYIPAEEFKDRHLGTAELV